VSLVIHTLDADVLAQTLQSLQRAVDHARAADLLTEVTVYLIDNSEQANLADALQQAGVEHLSQSALTILSGHGNLGFGRAHNLALTALSEKTALSPKTALSEETAVSEETALHLILNPDVFLEPDTLSQG